MNIERKKTEEVEYNKSVLTMVRIGVEPSSVIGVSAPMVLVTLRPEGVHTSQAHPEPKAVLPAFSNSVRNAAYDPKDALMRSATAPVGSPPPPFFMHSQ